MRHPSLLLFPAPSLSFSLSLSLKTSPLLVSPQTSTPTKLQNRKSHLENALDKARPPLLPLRALELQVPSVVRGDDLLPGLGVVEHGVCVREEAVEGVVEDGGREEGVDVADVEAAGGLVGG